MLSYRRPKCNNHNKKLWAKIEIQSCQLQKYTVITTHMKKQIYIIQKRVEETCGSTTNHNGKTKVRFSYTEIISYLNSFDLDVKTKTKERASHHLLSCKIFHCLGANIDQGREPLGIRVNRPGEELSSSTRPWRRFLAFCFCLAFAS